MKYSIIAAVIVLSAVVLILVFGDRLISSRHTIGSYTHVLVATDARAITGDEIWHGTLLALQQNGMNTNAWVLSPLSTWQPAGMTWPVGEEPNSILIVLSNQHAREEVYVRVATQPGTNTLSYELYRPK